VTAETALTGTEGRGGTDGIEVAGGATTGVAPIGNLGADEITGGGGSTAGAALMGGLGAEGSGAVVIASWPRMK